MTEAGLLLSCSHPSFPRFRGRNHASSPVMSFCRQCRLLAKNMFRHVFLQAENSPHMQADIVSYFSSLAMIISTRVFLENYDYTFFSVWSSGQRTYRRAAGSLNWMIAPLQALKYLFRSFPRSIDYGLEWVCWVRRPNHITHDNKHLRGFSSYIYTTGS